MRQRLFGVAVLLLAVSISGSSVADDDTSVSTKNGVATGISGRVTDASNGSGIEGVQVYIYEQGVEFEIAVAFTDSNGDYSTQDPLTPGTHFVRTVETFGFVDQLHAGIACPFFCDASTGTAIQVDEGETTEVNFELQPGASISGTVATSDAEPAPIAAAEVRIYDASGDYLTSSWPDEAGAWMTANILPGGSYFARVSRAAPHIGELYDDEPCPFESSCDVTTGFGIVVPAGTDVSGIDFELAAGGTISGVVTDVSAAAPVEGAFLVIYDDQDREVSVAGSGSDGVYTTFDGLVAGNYFVLNIFGGDDRLVPELYDDMACPWGCDVADGTPVAVASEEQVTGIDFNLDRYGGLAGFLRSEAVGVAIPQSGVQIYDSAGNLAPIDPPIDGDGHWFTDKSLPPGQYFARSTNASGFLNQVFDGMDCMFCDPTTGDVVTIDSDVITGDIDFALVDGSSISGTVIDGSTFDGIDGVTMVVFESDGDFVDSIASDPSGFYRTEVPLMAGDYLVLTANDSGFLDKVWDDVNCNGCDILEDGTPLTVSEATDVSGIDFVLFQGSSISGTVADEGTQLGIEGVLIEIYDVNGEAVAGATTGSDGVYLTETILPAGTYFAMTSDSGAYLPELYDGLSCAFGCDVTNGTVIDLGPAQALPGIDFGLEMGGTISGSISDAATSDPIAGLTVSVYSAGGSLVAVASSDESGAWITEPVLVSGSYFVATTANSGWLDLLHDGLQCNGGCDVTTGTPVAVVGGADTSGIDFSMVSNAEVFDDGFESGDASAWNPLP